MMTDHKISDLEIFDPSIPVPDISELNLLTCTKEQIILAMCRWFLQNYEDPVQNCPWDEGEYVYIWGGPTTPEETFQETFGHIIDEDVLNEAAKRIEDEYGHETIEWSHIPVQEEEEDDAAI